MKTAALALMIGCGMTFGATWRQEARSPVAAPASHKAEAPTPKGIPVPDMPVLKKTELDGGLIVEDMKLGDGYEVKTGDVVVAHYHETLRSDPTMIIDSSYKRGEPLALPLVNVIPGWRVGVAGMKIGGIRRLIIPAAMAYGEKPPRPWIPANSDLVFVTEIVDAMQVEDLKVGNGESATSRCVAVTAYTITDKNGKVIEKHDASDPYIWVQNEYQPMALGLEGMKRGGKRKITVPAALNRSNPVFGTARPENVPVTIEVELLNLRNIPPDADAPGC